MSDVSPNFTSPALPNNYFRVRPDYSPDKVLYNSLITECYNKFGVEMSYYIVTYDTNYDQIFGEDMDREVLRNFDVQAYYELLPEIELFSKMGIEGTDNFHMYISKNHFSAASTVGVSGSVSGEGIYPEYIPHAGDIIKAKYNTVFYEIVTVKEEEQIFLQTKHSWDLIVRVMPDKHMRVNISLSGDSIYNFMNTKEIYSISGAVEQEKSTYLYDGSNEKPANDPFGKW